MLESIIKIILLLIAFYVENAKAQTNLRFFWNKNPEPDIDKYELYQPSECGNYDYSNSVWSGRELLV